MPSEDAYTSKAGFASLRIIARSEAPHLRSQKRKHPIEMIGNVYAKMRPAEGDAKEIQKAK